LAGSTSNVMNNCDINADNTMTLVLYSTMDKSSYPGTYDILFFNVADGSVVNYLKIVGTYLNAAIGSYAFFYNT
jgi:hypothetical protein